MSRPWCSPLPDGVRLAVQITPNANKSEVIGVLDDVLKIRLHAQPIEGKANDALVRYLATMLDVPRSAVEITHGHTSKRKMIDVSASGLTVQKVELVLTPASAK